MKHLREDETQVTLLWLALGLALVTAIGRGFWLYRASLAWPTADGVITRLDVDRLHDPGAHGGHYFRATFSYDFRDPQGNRLWGTWNKDFSSEVAAREFAERELPLGKKVVVRFSPQDPSINSLELDSWTCTGDRPPSLFPKPPSL
jgi:Protein of unknown function (DUF3592)